MVKRITITLPDDTAEALEEWAKEEGRPTANLVTFLVQKAISEKQEQPKPPENRD
ncbi:MAG: ribbon-helix-helix protein, CopG family [Leptolyngbyaceae cyanobacterium SM1_3_5]|nr:ribbon-helix-helix protein, CopG family [Leptolyngbyaceae cyanobacterium SM1_3_5]